MEPCTYRPCYNNACGKRVTRGTLYLETPINTGLMQGATSVKTLHQTLHPT